MTDVSTPSGLRKVIIPTDLVGKFLSLASSNTRKNLETCGILAGKLVSVTVGDHSLDGWNYFVGW